MRAVVQRVSHAEVRIGGEVAGRIGAGYLVLLGVAQDDTAGDAAWLVARLPRLRLFDGPDGRMSRDLREAGGAVLVVSQFTLFASTRKGTRPSWHRAAGPAAAEALIETFTGLLEAALEQTVARGRFGAAMAIELVNDGPVTLILDSRARE
jgi:D-aminoacyl-tRNA deacylase